MTTYRFSGARYWKRLSIKYKIVYISASLIALRLILNGNYFIGHQQIERYHEFERHVHEVSAELYDLKSAFTEIFFTNGALPQMERSRQLLLKNADTFNQLVRHHGDNAQFHDRIIELQQHAEQLQITLERILLTPQRINLSEPDAMILLGKMTAMINHLFDDVHQLIEDVTVYASDRRKETFNAMLTMGMIIFSVGLLFLIMLYRGVMGPLKLLEEMRGLIRRVRTDGDLSAKIAEESDTEVGRLARDFNELIASLDENLGKTSRTVSLVAEHVERLSHEVRESHDAVDHQQHELFHLGNTIRKMAETLHSLNATARTLSRSVDELEQHASAGEELLQQSRQFNHALEQHLSAARQQLVDLLREIPTPAVHNVRGEALRVPAIEVTQVEPGSERLPCFSQEAANGITLAAAQVASQRVALQRAERPMLMLRQLSASLISDTQHLLDTIATEQAVLKAMRRDIDEITTIEHRAAFTTNLITTASDELLYLSKLLSAEVRRYRTSPAQSAVTAPPTPSRCSV
jgi:HAMP domain-containing protein